MGRLGTCQPLSCKGQAVPLDFPTSVQVITEALPCIPANPQRVFVQPVQRGLTGWRGGRGGRHLELR